MAATHLDPLALMTKLISFPTVSRDSNLPLVDWVESYLNSHGIPAHRVFDETGKKAALFAHVGPDVEGGIVLSGHTDVVPVDGQAWDTDPWTVIEKDGKGGRVITASGMRDLDRIAGRVKVDHKMI